MDRFIKIFFPSLELNKITEDTDIRTNKIDLVFNIKESDYSKAMSDGFIILKPAEAIEKQNEKKDFKSNVRKIKEPLKFKYIESVNHFVFDIVEEFKNLNDESKKHIEEALKSNGVSSILLGKAAKSEFYANISPLKYSQLYFTDSKEFENLDFKRIRGFYYGASAYVTKEEVEDYNNFLIPAYLEFLEKGIFPTRKIEKVNSSIKHQTQIENNKLFKSRKTIAERFYFSETEGFIFDEITGYCKRRVNKTKEENVFKITTYYKTGEKKTVCYHKIRSDQVVDFLSGKRYVSYLQPQEGVGVKLFNKNGVLQNKTYYGLANTVRGMEKYSDYTKSFNKFFKSIEKTLSIKLNEEEKDHIVSIFYKQSVLSIVNIEKTMKESYGIKIKSFENIEELMDWLELMFSS